MTAEQLFVQYFLSLVRVASFVATMPALGQNFVPRMVKVGLAVTMALMMMPADSGAAAVTHFGWVGLSIGVAREFIVGAILGFSCALVLDVVKVMGAYIGHQMGLALGSANDVIDNDAVTLFGQLLEMFAIVLLFSMDAHHLMLLGLHHSFVNLPLADSWSVPLAERATAQALKVPEWGLVLGGPIVIFLFAITCFNSVLMRATPQFNLFSVGIALRVAAGLAALLIWFPQVIALLARMIRAGHFLGIHG